MDVEDEAVLASHATGGGDLVGARRELQRCAEMGVSRPEANDCVDGEADGGRIDGGAVAGDDALPLEAEDPSTGCGLRQADPSPHLRIAEAPIGLQQGEDLPVGLVERFHRVQRLSLRDHSQADRPCDAFHHAGSRVLHRLAAGDRKQR
ncbi:hypothetical protein GCM10017712_26220 [Curtobacterium citreum]